MDGPTDIVITTCNRLEYLKRTLAHIYERTTTPYRLHVIDDASEEGNADWLWDEFKAGRVHHLYLRGERTGVMAGHNLAAWASFSDPVVLCDDDILCPLVRPDWLRRGLQAMERRLGLGMLVLRHPGAKVKPYKKDGEVAYVRSVGGTFLFCRREFLLKNPHPHKRGLPNNPMAPRCETARKLGWSIGVLQETFCYHIGEDSALTGGKYQGRFVDVVDWDTLEPKKRYW